MITLDYMFHNDLGGYFKKIDLTRQLESTKLIAHSYFIEIFIILYTTTIMIFVEVVGKPLERQLG
jgi:hypothetical protein